jgi:hypothetical protein
MYTVTIEPFLNAVQMKQSQNVKQSHHYFYTNIGFYEYFR